MTELHSKQKTKKLLAALFIGSLLISYTVVNTKKNHQLMTDARKLSLVVSEPIEWIETLSVHMGKKIVEHNDYKDLPFINKMFKETLQMQGVANRIISWSMFSWSNKDHQLTVNAVDGIRKNPEDLIERQYTWRARYSPWMIQVTKAGVGMLSNTLIIPAAVGVSNIRDEFQGAIVSGINAKELLRKAEESVSSGNAFLILNRDTFHTDSEKILLSSSNSSKASKDYEKLPALVEKLRDWVDPAGSSPITISAGRYKYNYYRLIEGYQLAVLVGFNRLEFWGDVFVLWMQLLIGSLALSFLTREAICFSRKN